MTTTEAPEAPEPEVAAPEEAAPPEAAPEEAPEPAEVSEEGPQTEYVGTTIGVGYRQFQGADGSLWDVDPETGKVTGKA